MRGHVVAERVVTWVADLVEPEISGFFPTPAVVLRLDRHLGLLDLAVSRTAATGDWPRYALAVVAQAWTSPTPAWELFEEAVDLLRGCGDKLAMGAVLNSYGWPLLQHDEPDAAAPLVREALTTRPAAGADGLVSARERHVATLVAEGLTNRQIGQRLGISPHTVARHVTHARTKLGLRSRAQLAVWAGRQVR